MQRGPLQITNPHPQQLADINITTTFEKNHFVYQILSVSVCSLNHDAGHIKLKGQFFLVSGEASKLKPERCFFLYFQICIF